MYIKLREFRLKNNVSWSKLAELLGVNKSTYYKKENGVVKFTVEEAYKIASYLNISIEELFFDSKVS